MANLKFADTHNMVAFLSKPTESEGFEQIVDFLNAHPIKYALTINPTIYISCIEQFWSTIKAKTINGEQQLHALVDGKKVIITESNVRRDLQLEDEEGVDCLPNATIFEQLALMGVTPLFPTMVVQNQAELGEGSAIRTDPHHTPTIIQPSTSQPQKTQKLMKPKRKDTQVVVPGAKKPWGIQLLKLDEDITLVSVQDDANKEMFSVDTLNGEEDDDTQGKLKILLKN
ncbi:hypothetical protein Tco_0916682 [Tanacetum coccineum]